MNINADGAVLQGLLEIPAGATALVVFAHGSGSSRFSRRNQQVAGYLNGRGFGTLLFDLLTAEENAVDQLTREHRFNIALLAERLACTLDWLTRQPELQGLALGLFGASTGAAAALIAAAERPQLVQAVVSRGGRPDLAGEFLARVRAPTLLLVGGDDEVVIGLNQQAADCLTCERRLDIVPGATHLFEEPGKLEQICELAGDWFERYLNALPESG